MVKSDNIPLSGFGDWFSNAWDSVSGWVTDAANWVGDTFFGGSHEVNQTNQSIANQNIAFQQYENELTRQREDNAHQRAAADLEAAGLSKTLAAGNPASAQALTAPNNSYQMQRNLAGQNAMKSMVDFYFDKRADKRAGELNDAQVAKLDAETKSQEISNQYMADVYNADIVLKTAQTEQTQATIESIKIQNQINEIVRDTKAASIQSDIDEKLAQSDYYLAQVGYTQKNIEYLSEKITSEILSQDRVKALTELDKQKLDNLVREYIKSYYEIESLKHNLNFAQDFYLPTGTILNGNVGSWLNFIRSLGHQVSHGAGKFFDDSNGPNFTVNPDGSGFYFDPEMGLADYF